MKNFTFDYFEAFWTLIFFTKNPQNQPTKMKTNQKRQK